MHHLTASAVTARRVTLEFNALLTKPVSIPEPWLTRIQVDARVRF
jgi:hypothetical protein